MEPGWDRPNKTGITLFMTGAIFGFALFVSMFFYDSEAIVFSPRLSGDEPLISMSCPDLLTHDETGEVRATIYNRTDKTLYRTVRTHISEGFLIHKQEHTEHFEMAPGERRTFSWPVSVDQAAWDYVTLVRVNVLRQNPYPSYVGTCGVAWVDIPFVQGWHLITGGWVVSLSLMAVGMRRYLLANKPLVAKRCTIAKNLAVIAVMVVIGMATIFIELWYLELILFIFTMILIAESIFVFSQN